MVSKGFRVVCQDGRVRHKKDFDRPSDARHWANWGHVCTNNHQIVDLDFEDPVAEAEAFAAAMSNRSER